MISEQELLCDHIPMVFSIWHGFGTYHSLKHDLCELAVPALLVHCSGCVSLAALGTVVCLAAMCHIAVLTSDLLCPGCPLVILWTV